MSADANGGEREAAFEIDVPLVVHSLSTLNLCTATSHLHVPTADDPRLGARRPDRLRRASRCDSRENVRFASRRSPRRLGRHAGARRELRSVALSARRAAFRTDLGAPRAARAVDSGASARRHATRRIATPSRRIARTACSPSSPAAPRCSLFSGSSIGTTSHARPSIAFASFVVSRSSAIWPRCGTASRPRSVSARPAGLDTGSRSRSLICDVRCICVPRTRLIALSFRRRSSSRQLPPTTASLCPNGHPLKLFSAADVLVTWYCDSCNLGRDARWGRPNVETRFICAQGCNFDLCRACAAPPPSDRWTCHSDAAIAAVDDDARR
jgi:hypothetical protein